MDNQIAIQFSDTIINAENAHLGFVVYSNEATYVHGPTELKTSKAISAILSTTDKDSDTLIITLNRPFSNSSGNIRVLYDAGIGGMYGKGGIVESFDMSFTPTGLTPNMSPNPLEYLSTTINTKAIIYPILSISVRSGEEYITVGTSTSAAITQLYYRNINQANKEYLNTTINTRCTITDLTSAIP